VKKGRDIREFLFNGAYNEWKSGRIVTPQTGQKGKRGTAHTLKRGKVKCMSHGAKGKPETRGRANKGLIVRRPHPFGVRAPPQPARCKGRLTPQPGQGEHGVLYLFPSHQRRGNPRTPACGTISARPRWIGNTLKSGQGDHRALRSPLAPPNGGVTPARRTE